MKQKILEMLNKQFGAVVDLDFKLMGKNRVYAYKPCDLDIQEKHSGIYFGTIEKDGLRLSIEGSYIVGRVAKKSVVEVDEEKAVKWMRGDDVESNATGYVILKWGNYYLGCGKGNGRKIRNFVPKSRRIK